MSQRFLSEEHLRTSVVGGFSGYIFCLSIGLKGGFWSRRKKDVLRTTFYFLGILNIQNVFNIYIQTHTHIYIHTHMHKSWSLPLEKKQTTENCPRTAELLAYKMDIPPSAFFTKLHWSEWTSQLEFLSSPVWSIDFRLDILISDFLGGSQTAQVKLTWGQCLKM